MIVLSGVIVTSFELWHLVVENGHHTVLPQCHTPFEFSEKKKKIYLVIILHQLKVSRIRNYKWTECIENDTKM